MMNFLLVSALLQPTLAAIPSAPSAWNTRGGSPKLAWSFRQSDCVAKNIPCDTAVTLPLSASSAASCPYVTWGGVQYSTARQGVSVVDPLDLSNMRASNIGAAFVGFNDAVSSFTDLHVEIIFTTRVSLELAKNYRIFEIANLAATSASVSGTETLFFVEYLKNSGADLLQWGSRGINSANSELSSLQQIDSTALPNLELLGNSVNETWIFGLALDSKTSSPTTCIGNVYLSKLGTPSVQSYTLNPAGAAWKRYVIPTDAILRVGSTIGAGTTFKGYPVDYHWVAVYGGGVDTVLSSAQVNAHSVAGLPNSNPVGRQTTDAYLHTFTEDQTDAYLNLNLSTIWYDQDNDSPTLFQLVTTPTFGSITKSGTALVAGSTWTITDFTNNLVKFVPALDAYSSTFSSPSCSSTYASFTYKMSDGKCDGVTSPATRTECMSPNAITANICVKEVNDAPFIPITNPSYVSQASILTSQNKSNVLKLACMDKDASSLDLGLKTIRVLNQTRPDLGRVRNQTSGFCASADHNFTASPLTQNLYPTGQNVFSQTSLCYTAMPTTSNEQIVGEDIITYECIDNQGASVIGTFKVVIYNALLAGCGSGENANQVKCEYSGAEDTNFTVILRGVDGAPGHINENRRYRLDTVPKHGVILDPADPSQTLAAGAVVPVDLATGTAILTYRPYSNYYNQYCANNNPVVNEVTNNWVGCGSATLKRDKDMLDAPLFNCSNSLGCPDTFSFTHGYIQNSVLSFGPTHVDGVVIWVTNTWDFPPVIHSVDNVTNIPTSTWVYMNGTSVGFVDGDVRRVGFRLRPSTFKFLVSITGMLAGVPPYSRIYFGGGKDCLEPGCTTPKIIYGKAYPSDLNKFLQYLRIKTNRDFGNDTLDIEIVDPNPDVVEGMTGPTVNYTGSYVDFAEDNIDSEGTFSSDDAEHDGFLVLKSIYLDYGSPSDVVGDTSLGWTIIVGISAGALIIVLACIACLFCVVRRARQGEQAALWVVRNILCSDVARDESKMKETLSKRVTGARTSLEREIHAEHARMVEVVWCALLCRRVCYCVVKFDATNVKVPDEESMMREALTQEERKIAVKHLPATPQGGVPARSTSKDDVEEDELADDDIFDWEKHQDPKSGKVFYYNARTGKSSWTPPVVRVHSTKAVDIKDRVSVKDPLFTPKPPTDPRPKDAPSDANAEEDRIKQA